MGMITLDNITHSIGNRIRQVEVVRAANSTIKLPGTFVPLLQANGQATSTDERI